MKSDYTCLGKDSKRTFPSEIIEETSPRKAAKAYASKVYWEEYGGNPEHFGFDEDEPWMIEVTIKFDDIYELVFKLQPVIDFEIIKEDGNLRFEL